MENNTDWKDAAAQQRRQHLLSELNDWYLTAIDQVRKALERIADDKYGFCRACHAPVEPDWLDVCPESELCAACEELREKAA